MNSHNIKPKHDSAVSFDVLEPNARKLSSFPSIESRWSATTLASPYTSREDHDGSQPATNSVPESSPSVPVPAHVSGDIINISKCIMPGSDGVGIMVRGDCTHVPRNQHPPRTSAKHAGDVRCAVKDTKEAKEIEDVSKSSKSSFLSFLTCCFGQRENSAPANYDECVRKREIKE
jgi:hypothetical protein